MSNFDTQIVRQNQAPPDEKRLAPEDAALDNLMRLALRKWLTMGAVTTKDAAIKSRTTLQYQIGQAGQPAAARGFTVLTTPDINAEQVASPQGAYIVAIAVDPAGSLCRYTLSGRAPSDTFGMPISAGGIVYITVQDLESLQLAGKDETCVINLEFYQVDA